MSGSINGFFNDHLNDTSIFTFPTRRTGNTCDVHWHEVEIQISFRERAINNVWFLLVGAAGAQIAYKAVTLSVVL